MTIEYRIKFDKNELTITQRLEPDVSNGFRANARPSGKPAVAKGVALGGTFDESAAAPPRVSAEQGAGPEDNAGPGGGPGSMGQIVVFGPIVLCGPTSADAGPGGGFEDPPGPGGAVKGS
jgi:hypothetical protein